MNPSKLIPILTVLLPRAASKSNFLSVFALCVCTLALPVCTAFAQYSVTILHPMQPGKYVKSSGLGVSGGTQVGYGKDEATGKNHALLWSGSPASAIDLHPADFTESEALGAAGGIQVGRARDPFFGDGWKAFLWTGSAARGHDLNPVGFSGSEAYDIDPITSKQVGYGHKIGCCTHALLWSGSHDKFVDLGAPPGLQATYGYGIGGGLQVGFGSGSLGVHALMWSGTPESVVDLHPAGFTQSFAEDTDGVQQVGSGYVAGRRHALLWTGTAESAVDLNPAGFTQSEALGVSGGIQVGWGEGPFGRDVAHALLWRGSAASVVDLHAFLPPEYRDSFANGIDENGNIVGLAIDIASQTHAVVWQRIENTLAENTPAIHWINDASQNGATVLNSNAPFTTSFLGTNDVTVRKFGPNVTLGTSGFGGAYPGNNPPYLTNFVGSSSNGTGNGLAGRVGWIAPDRGGSIQLDFAIPLGTNDRILVVDVDRVEIVTIEAYSREGSNYVPVDLGGWTHEAFSGATGVLPDSRWATWASAEWGPTTGTLKSQTGNLSEPLDVLTPDQKIDRIVLGNWRNDTGTPAFQVIRLAPDACASFRPLMSIRAAANEVCWTSCPGAFYNVQYCSDLTTTNWVNLLTNIVGNGSVNCVVDPLPRSAPRRFYRIETVR